MSCRIIFDGLNLSLSRGTGIATYTRLLTHTARDLGHEVGVVYSTPFSPAKSSLLREITFFDESRLAKPARRKMTARRIFDYAVDQTLYHFPVKPWPVEFTGAVDSRQYADRLAAQDRAFVARNLFNNARAHFSRTRTFVRLAFDPQPNIFHCTYPLPLRVGPASNVYTIHDLVPLRLPFATQDDKRQIYRLLKKLARQADHIVTVSEHSKRDIIRLLGVEERRITNTYQAVDLPEAYMARPVSAIANQLDGAFGLEFGRYLLFYGALEPKKNIGRLIEAYLASSVEMPLVLVLAGGWQNETEAKLLARHQSDSGGSAQAKRCIRQLDYVEKSTLMALIRGARAVIFPSLYEGFGLPVLEAMALGTPAIASREAALPEIAGDAAMLVDPYDTEAIRRAICEIVNDDGLAAELASRGPARAARFSLARYRERVAELYATLV